MPQKTAIIIGAGPAGLTAALELLERSGVRPVILERSGQIGGISKTVEYKGNRMDIGGHRFFSKSDKVLEWWLRAMPLQGRPSLDDLALDREVPLSEGGPDPARQDKVMLIRSRLSRIYFLRMFFRYPLSLNFELMRGLGPVRLARILAGYVRARLFPIRDEKSLEDFMINRFGRELYRTFFRDYTEKVWGVPCSAIGKDWGAQRIKSLSLGRLLLHALRGIAHRERSIAQKNVETSLIEQFMYPKLGPGQLWEAVSDAVRSRGGEILMHHAVTGLHCQDGRVVAVEARNEATGEAVRLEADYVLSSAPVRDLVRMFRDHAPLEVREVAEGLRYRDFMTAGLLLRRLKIRNTSRIKTVNGLIPDNWIYIQEPEVRLGRLQVFNNWSPYLVRDQEHVWLGLEYFCNEGDDLWSMEDSSFLEFAAAELEKIGIIDRADVLDGTVIRVDKAYPAYFGTFDRFSSIRTFTDGFVNLYLIGRNGMHRYNNMDHSMLSAMEAVTHIVEGRTDKAGIWNVNAEETYHENK